MLKISELREKGRELLFKSEEKSDKNPWESDRQIVLLESRQFHESPIDAYKCSKQITKIMYLLFKEGSDSLKGPELTDLFFGITKLFQSNNHKLRRLVYLVLKYLHPSETEAFIVTSCLTKDMQSKLDSYRGNAIRVLARVVDGSTATSIDRFLRSGVVDRSPFVASAALLAGLRLVHKFPEGGVKKWVSEISEAMNVKENSKFVNFHALALMNEVRKSDRLAYTKMLASLASASVSGRGEYVDILLMRSVCEFMKNTPDRDHSVDRVFMHFIETSLRSKHEAVAFEAARTIIDLKADAAMGHAVTVLQILLSSAKAAVRFAAVRTLSTLAARKPTLVSKCNSDLEALLNDSNKSVSVLALATLLKTCHESHVERLVKQIQSLMGELGDGFKLEVVKAVTDLVKNYPNKNKPLLGFLSNTLRDEGSEELKNAAVEGLETIVLLEANANASASKDNSPALLALCEFIEDCEYAVVTCRVLDFIAAQAPKTANPKKFVRFVFNRLLLETPVVRARAAETLAKIAHKIPTLKADIRVLLEAALVDPDDSVRDLIAGLVTVLSEPEAVETVEDTSLALMVGDFDLGFNIDVLFSELESRLAAGGALAEQPVDIALLAHKSAVAVASAVTAVNSGVAGSHAPVGAAASVNNDEAVTRVLEAVHAISGEAVSEEFVVGEETLVTDAQAEYVVTCRKWSWASTYFALEFKVKNTVEDIKLENVTFNISGLDADNWFVTGSTSIAELRSGAGSETAVVLLQRRHDVTIGDFRLSMKMIVDEDGVKYEDELPLRVSVDILDYVINTNDSTLSWAVYDTLTAEVKKVESAWRPVSGPRRPVVPEASGASPSSREL
jgi:coatomer protein complex subunit gamma